MKIHFLGAADGVTGSRHLVDTGTQKILLDCGLFQGWKLHRERNWQPPGLLAEASAVVLSHAHLDHSGWLPALVARGWRGAIYASPATCDLAAVLLLDSAHLQEEDARRANRYGYSKHVKALPLYTRADAQRAIKLFVPLLPGRDRRVGDAMVRLTPVGHLLGACAVTLSSGGQRVVFSGDLGRSDDLLMPPPDCPSFDGPADALIIESTYGNRTHPATQPDDALAEVVRRTVGRGGSVLMPAFAVGRAQALLLMLQRLKRAGRIPAHLPIYLDSPMAEQATRLYQQHARLLRVPAREMRELVDGVHVIGKMPQSARLSAKLAAGGYPALVISASGMATGGRVLHHMKALAPDPRSTIVFAGFQVGGTRGARLVAGERDVKIHGEIVPVRAEVDQISGFSGHADGPGLLAWMRRLHAAPRQTFVVHGEPDAADTLRTHVQRELGWPVRVPAYGETVEF